MVRECGFPAVAWDECFVTFHALCSWQVRTGVGGATSKLSSDHAGNEWFVGERLFASTLSWLAHSTSAAAHKRWGDAVQREQIDASFGRTIDHGAFSSDQ